MLFFGLDRKDGGTRGTFLCSVVYSGEGLPDFMLKLLCSLNLEP